ncbi:threonine/serine ThrE exporter family protein [Nocardioides piscis]|uniref:Threonine/serine exporter family protein n=1 Tax=Nocardioides piscis TaxID=2714938 RepID=A0A6G7YBZ7_9ACTN|nr:threonine/serine exporter family protein [Nocardioides piscis]QIK74325.1 threonine/serine exporter family protein [Nocardioides piscis]
MDDQRELNLTLDLCLRIGEVLLSSGAGAADVTATMQSVARHLGLRHPEIDVTFTSVSMSFHGSPEEPPVLMIRKIKSKDIDYEDLTQVDHLVRDLLANRMDLYLARSRMATIVSTGHPWPRWSVTLAWGLMCASVAVFLGGGPLVALIASAAAMTIDRAQLRLARRRLPTFYLQVAGGAIATLFAVAVAATPLEVDLSLVITANIVMLLAGIGFMGAIQDALTGFYVTAGARVIEALLATAGIIAGVSGGLSVADVLGIDLGRLVPGQALGHHVLIGVVGAAVSAAAFAFACYAPWRVLVPIALTSGLATLLHAVVADSGFGRTWAAATGAFTVGLVAYAVAGRFRVPPLVVAVSAIVPLLPGLSIYRGLSLLSAGGPATSQGMFAMMTAASVAVALASGVILGEYLAQPLKRETRRLEERLAGPRLVGPLRVPRRGRSRAPRVS